MAKPEVDTKFTCSCKAPATWLIKANEQQPEQPYNPMPKSYAACDAHLLRAISYIASGSNFVIASISRRGANRIAK